MHELSPIAHDALNRENATLIVGPSWVGDMVMAQSLFQVLKKQEPGAAIDVLAPQWSRPLLERMPEVRVAIDMPVGHGELRLGVRRRLGRALRGRGYAHAIVLPNALKSALIPLWAGIPRRTGYVGEFRWGLLNDARRLDKARLPMTVQRFVALGQPADAPLPPAVSAPKLMSSAAGVEAALRDLDLARPAGPLLVLCPGAEYGPAKRWLPEHFAEVARARLERGWSVWLMGSANDAAATREVRERSGGECVDLGGRTTLAQAIDLMSMATCVVTNDSGLMHVAAGLRRPLVAVYGSSDPGFTPPLNPEAKIVSLGLACSPCFERRCPLGHLNCLRELKPEQVLAAMDEVA